MARISTVSVRTAPGVAPAIRVLFVAQVDIIRE